jgi:hypothetical protein
MTIPCEAGLTSPVIADGVLWPIISEGSNPGNSVTYENKDVSEEENARLICSTGQTKGIRTLRFKVKVPLYDAGGIEKDEFLSGTVEFLLPTSVSATSADLSRLLVMMQAPFGPCLFTRFRYGRFPLEQIPTKWIPADYYTSLI